MSSNTTINGVVAIFRNGSFIALDLRRKVGFSTSADDDLMGFDGIYNGILPVAIVWWDLLMSLITYHMLHMHLLCIYLPKPSRLNQIYQV